MQVSGSGGTSAQMQQIWEKMFSRVDADGNGSVSQNELEATRKNRPGGAAESAGGATSVGRIFAQLDTNGDGGLTSGEIGGGPPPSLAPQGAIANSSLAVLLRQQEEDDDEKAATDKTTLATRFQDSVTRMLDAYGRNGPASQAGSAAGLNAQA